MPEPTRAPKGKQSFTWDDPPTWIDAIHGIRIAPLTFFGDGDPESAEIVIIDYPPHTDVPVHFHRGDYCSVVVTGSIQVNRTWHSVGDVRIVKAGTAYGLRTGDEGCRLIEIFQTAAGDLAIPVDAKDAEEFAETQRRANEAVEQLADVAPRERGLI